MTSPTKDDRNLPFDIVQIRDLPERLLAVSDLHLGYGRDSSTGRYHPAENFFADAAFRRLLEHYDPQKDGPSLLVLNGDTFDFLRITGYVATPQDMAGWSAALQSLNVNITAEDLKQSLVPKERKFGLRTDKFKSVWKLLRIADGHRDFFAALGWWVSRGGTIAFVKGNHDLELHWPLVQVSICREIARGYPNIKVGHGVLFVEDKLRAGNTYFEHGHIYEPVTKVIGDVTRNRGQELTLPLGSFVNRYIINKLERLEPFLDNIKPVQNLLWALVRRHPLTVFVILWRSLTFIRRAARPYWLRDSFGFLLYFASLLLPVLTLAVIAAALLASAFGDFVRHLMGTLRFPLSIAGIAAPYVVGTVRDLIPRRRFSAGDDRHGQGAYETMKEIPFPPDDPAIYGVMGHTHAPDVQQLRHHGTQSLYYINCGSWAPSWREERPDLTGKTIYSFVLFDLIDGHYKHKCLEWRDDRGCPTEAVILNEHAG